MMRDSCDAAAADEGRSGETLWLIRVLLRVETMVWSEFGWFKWNVFVAETRMSHEKMRAFYQ